MNQGGPSKEQLLEVYDWLDKKMHPHHLLPLETRLPEELKRESRDKYRIIMTMILSGLTLDKALTKSLSKLFKCYTDFQALRGLGRYEIKQLLSESGVGLNDPDHGGNGGRLWSLLECYFGTWGETVTERNIQDLYQKKGFKGGKFARLLQAYCFGNNHVVPLDTPALNALRDPLFPGYCVYSGEEIRKDIEDKLRDEPKVSLIDFHEMLRFLEQYTGKSSKEQDNIIIGWNAWRLLCSSKRERITRDWTWIYDHLVQEKGIAEELWRFYHKITL